MGFGRFHFDPKYSTFGHYHSKLNMLSISDASGRFYLILSEIRAEFGDHLDPIRILAPFGNHLQS